MEYLIGIDIGTTATKAVLFTKSGKELTIEKQGYSLYRDEKGMAEENFSDIFEAVLTTIAKLTATLSKNEKILAVSFSCQMHSLIAYTQEWKSLTRVITWADSRAKAEIDALKARNLGKEIFLKTGTPLHSMSPFAKLLWLKKEKKAVYDKAAHYLDLKGAIFKELFEVNKIELSTASATGLLNIFNHTWEKEALNAVEITSSQLPEIVSPYETERKLKENYALQMELPQDTPFVWGASDGALANLGAGASQANTAALTIGTSGAIRVISSRPKIDAEMRTFTYLLDEKHWLTGGPVNSGGDVLRWIRESLFENACSFEEIIEKIAQIPAGAGGLIFLPYLGGERAPLWNSDARGTFFGLNYEHSKAHLARAALEGIIFNLYLVKQSLEEVVGKLTRILASGGFTHSQLWLQILADIFGQEIEVQKSAEQGCFGAVLMAEKSLGLTESTLSENTRTIIPNKENTANYRQILSIFSALSEKLDKEWQKISAYQKNIKK